MNSLLVTNPKTGGSSQDELCTGESLLPESRSMRMAMRTLCLETGLEAGRPRSGHTLRGHRGGRLLGGGGPAMAASLDGAAGRGR